MVRNKLINADGNKCIDSLSNLTYLANEEF